MPNRSKKIVFWGTVLTTVSFIFGLFHAALPATFNVIADDGVNYSLHRCFCPDSTEHTPLFTVTIVTLIFLTANPLGILLCLAIVLMIRYRCAEQSVSFLLNRPLQVARF